MHSKTVDGLYTQRNKINLSYGGGGPNGSKFQNLVFTIIVAYRPVARQPPKNKLYNSRYKVTAPQKSMFPCQKLNCNKETAFSARSEPI
jgi:hypothetical protein